MEFNGLLVMLKVRSNVLLYLGVAYIPKEIKRIIGKKLRVSRVIETHDYSIGKYLKEKECVYILVNISIFFIFIT